jgi:hypothetical protein
VPPKIIKIHCLKEEVSPRGAREELCLVSNLKPINPLRRKPERENVYMVNNTNNR